MSNQAEVVVIGGGVVGCSVLYHLTKRGWTDVALLERDELTSGSTWHAAGGMHTINMDTNVARLQHYTIQLYKEIEELSGQATGMHLTGGVLMAGTKERLEWLKMVHSRGRYLGLNSEIISAREAAEMVPLIDPKFFVGALKNDMEGHVDPSGVTQAYAKAARQNGAQVHRHTKVESITRDADGHWRLATSQGEWTCAHVVNAGGLWAREVGRMVGLELPLLAMEHMYLLTEDMPEVKAFNAETGHEVPHVIDFEGELYLRQEGGGMLMGTYEKAGKPWSERVTPWDFGHELLAPDLDRIAPSLEVGFAHFPAFQNAGIKQIINGPFTFAPDGNPLVGPVRGLPGFWCACAVMAGFSQGGGVGLALANWMVDGDPGFDIWGMDVSRFGNWATMGYTNAKVRENYSRRFQVRYPNEELPAARPLKTTPVHDRLAAMGAVFGESWGTEIPLWYAPEGVGDVVSFHRSTDFPHVGAECRAVREAVGLMEISGFAKYLINGAGARDWLDHVLAGRMPEPGQIKLNPMLNEKGRVIGDFTLANLGPARPGIGGDGHDRFFLLGSGPAEDYHMRWFEAQDPGARGACIAPTGLSVCGLAIAGPKSRDLLAGLTHEDVSSAAFPFLTMREMDLGAIPCRIGRVSFTGELGYEIWVHAAHQRALLDLLLDAGAPLGLKPFGGRALNSLRLEKGFGGWAREFRPIHTALECGLNRFVAKGKSAPFIGRDAHLAALEAGGTRRLRLFRVEADDADPLGDESVFHGDRVVGWVSSGGYGHGAGTSLALAYVEKDLASEESGWSIEILGEKRRATLSPDAVIDPNGLRMRG